MNKFENWAVDHVWISILLIVVVGIALCVGLMSALTSESVCEDAPPSEYGCVYDGATLEVDGMVAICRCKK